MFQPVESSVSFPKLEVETIRFWKQKQIYEKSLAAETGRRHSSSTKARHGQRSSPSGHCLTRAIKDLFPRYKTMRGYRCDRKAGWDTHGLPVEVEVCKELGIHAKEEIESYGIEPFIHKCVESVFRYMRQWEDLTERLGFWIHLDEAYVTFHQSYVESVWWALKTLFDRGLLYQATRSSGGGPKAARRSPAARSVRIQGSGGSKRVRAVPVVEARFRVQVQGSGPRAACGFAGTSAQRRSARLDHYALDVAQQSVRAVKPDLEYSVVRFKGDSRSVCWLGPAGAGGEEGREGVLRRGDAARRSDGWLALPAAV